MFRIKLFFILLSALLVTASFFVNKKNKPPQKFLLERSYSVKNTSPTAAFKIKVNIPDVVSVQNAQVLKATYSTQPKERKTFANGMQQMIFELNLKPGEEQIIKLEWEIQLKDMNVLETVKKPTLGAEEKETLGAEEKELYLKSGTLYECDHPEIVKKTAEIISGKTTELEKSKAIFDYVKNNITFHRFGAESKGALYALQNGKGDCTEYASLVVAMCRAAKIPSRLNGVMVLKTDTGSAGTDNHNHAEIFLEDYGWVPAETTFKSASLGDMFNFEIILRKGLRTDKSNGWFSFNVATKYNNLKEIKMLGHKWKKIN
ncbi:MAG: transglutaminase domain-containing protein [Bacteroidia bacterium]|nr:transglutaminase domain-containing protein [Bacteroidia bacterium]